ncbi:MAG TPA: aspartate/glutamate racemase family protein [Vineibacter sp.]|nr:aspartate/glutamate racemase family protein [Vineibacter sp.]
MSRDSTRPHLLVVNPNSSQAVSRRIGALAAEWLNGRAEVEVITSTGGPDYLGDSATLRAGEAAALAAVEEQMRLGRRIDAILMACFADIGQSIHTLSGKPVCNLLSASLAAVESEGRRFAIVTAGAQWQDLLPPMVGQALPAGARSSLAAVRTFQSTGTAVAVDPAAALPALERAVLACINLDKVDVVIVGGAGLSGLAMRIQRPPGVKIVDCLEAGLAAALSHATGNPIDGAD